MRIPTFRTICYLIVAVMIVFVMVQFNAPIQRYIRDAQTSAMITARQRSLIEASNRLRIVREILDRFEKTEPPYSRVRVVLIHNGKGGDGTAPTQWDAIAGFAKPGHLLGTLFNDRPLSEWDDYISSLLNDRCSVITHDSLNNDAAKARMIASKTVAVLACPILNRKGELLGAVFGGWDDTTPLPTDLDALKPAFDALADEIAKNIKPVD